MKDRATELVEWMRGLSPRWWRIMRVTWLRRGQSSANTMAAAIGFYALICIGPLGLLLAWALQIVVGPGDRSYEWLQNTVNRLAGETAGAIMGEIDALLTNPNAHVAGIFSFLVLLWAGLRLFESLEISLTEIWPQGEDRGLIARKLVALGSMVGSGVLFVVLILLTAVLPSLLEVLGRIAPVGIDQMVLLQPGIVLVAELAIAFAAFFLLFKFIPAHNVPTRVAAVGAIFTGVAWRAVTPIFTLTVARSAENSTVYGGLAGVVMFLTWAFFSAHVLLLGAHLAAAYEHVVSRETPASLDDSFVRMSPSTDTPEEARGEDEGEFYGPRTYPPPGHV
ncbi:MAG: YihY/virulence factor BrkB family protein [Armatimonadota bacterium]